MGYLAYYALWFVVSLVLANPYLLIGFLVLFVAQRWLPDPVRLFARRRTARRLEAEIALNRANSTARRDLGRIRLDQRRNGAALALFDEALAKEPGDAELHYLRGVALLGLGRGDTALEALGRAVELDASVGRGQPFFLAGQAHERAGRFAEAEEAYEHVVGENHSSVAARVRLAAVRERLGRKDEARAARRDAIETYRTLPSYLRRAQLGDYVRVRLADWFGG